MLERWLQAEIEVIPAVDVLGAGAVRLHQGAYDDVVERAGDPVELARAFGEAGAPRIHLVDLDGARTGRVRPGLVRDVAAAVSLRRSRPPAASEASTTRGRCSRQEPTASSSERQPSRTRRRGPSSASGSSSHSTSATDRFAPPAGR